MERLWCCVQTTTLHRKTSLMFQCVKLVLWIWVIIRILMAQQFRKCILFVVGEKLKQPVFMFCLEIGRLCAPLRVERNLWCLSINSKLQWLSRKYKDDFMSWHYDQEILFLKKPCVQSFMDFNSYFSSSSFSNLFHFWCLCTHYCYYCYYSAHFLQISVGVYSQITFLSIWWLMPPRF